MAKNKTTETATSVSGFVNTVADETKRRDSFRLIDIIQKQTGFEPRMWGPSIVGFGAYHYKYESGHEGDAPLAGFAPRSTALVLYVAPNPEKREAFLKNLGKHKTGKGCIYIKKLDDINLEVLTEMVRDSVTHLQAKYPPES